jgi:hypothetical protein
VAGFGCHFHCGRDRESGPGQLPSRRQRLRELGVLVFPYGGGCVYAPSAVPRRRRGQSYS